MRYKRKDHHQSNRLSTFNDKYFKPCLGCHVTNYFGCRNLVECDLILQIRNDNKNNKGVGINESIGIS
jgi:hypothetical protein